MNKIHIGQAQPFFIILLFALIISQVSGSSTPVTWVPSSYFITGRYSLTPTYWYQYFNVPYTASMTGPPKYLTDLGIIDYSFSLSDSNLYLYLVCDSVYQSYFTIYIEVDSISYFMGAMRISYLSVDPSYPYTFSISYFGDSSLLQGPFTQSYYVNFTASTGNILNLTHDNAMLAWLHMFDLYNVSNGCFNVDIQFIVYNQSFYEATASTSCSMQMDLFGFSRLIFDKTMIESLGYDYFTYGQLDSINGNTSTLSLTTDFYFDSNFMFGMKCFSMSGVSSINFMSTLGGLTTVSSSNYKELNFMYWTFRLRVCPNGYPYFDVDSQMCYDVCPDGTFPNNTILTCPPCNYTCLTCSSFNVCTNCNASTNRYQNGSACPPSPGYFDNNTAMTVPCSTVLSQCLICTSSTNCISCNTGYYPNTTCLPCNSKITYCTDCAINLTMVVTCVDCEYGYIVNANGSSCVRPPCNIPNCLFCWDDPNICVVCNVGWQTGNVTTLPNGTVENSCVQICGDGLTVGNEQCDDGNNIDGDGCNSDCTIGNNNGCPKSAPFISPATNSCSAICPDGYFENDVAFTCDLCSYDCLTCSSLTVCLTCNSADHRYQNGSTCPPQPGYFQNNTQVCPSCDPTCPTCFSLTQCLSCIRGYFLNETSCILCESVIDNCTECTGSPPNCTHCAIRYFVNESTNLCDIVPCQDLNCIQCPLSLSKCTTCFQGYQPVSGICEAICGDFLCMPEQQCDDGNVANGDGCSSACQVEQWFTCSPSPSQPLGSECYFMGPLNITPIDIFKVPGQNAVEIDLDVSPSDLDILNLLNFNDIISANSSKRISNIKAIRNPNGTVSVIVEYAESIQGEVITITIDPNISGNRFFSKASPTSKSVTIIPQNNQDASYYPDAAYHLQGATSKLANSVGLASLGVFALGLISGKMIGVEMMAVVQIAFFSLMSLSQMNPCFSALSSLRFVNGYNQLNQSNYLLDPFQPIPPKGIAMFSRFTENFNFTALIIIIPLLVALIAFILSKTAMKNSQKALTVAQRAVGEYAFMGLMFSGYLITISFALEVMFGSKNSKDLIGKVSIAQSSLFMLVFGAYFVFILLKPNFFGEFTNEFKNDKLSSKFYNAIMLERLCVGMGLVLLLKVNAEAVIPMVVLVAVATFVALKRPYKKQYHNVRQIANMGIAIIVECVYLAFKLTDNGVHNTSQLFFYLPLIICGLLVVCVGYKGAAIGYSIFKLIKSVKGDPSSTEKEEMKFLEQQRKGTADPFNFLPFQRNNMNETSSQLNNLASPTHLSQLRKGLKANLFTFSKPNSGPSELGGSILQDSFELISESKPANNILNTQNTSTNQPPEDAANGISNSHQEL